MRHGTPNSKPASVAMCTTDNQPLSSSTSERDFLADRATDARAAIVRTLCDMKGTLTTMTGVRSCAALHPWLLTGSAVVAGVVAGAVLTPSARQRVRRARETPAGPAADAPPAHREQQPTRTMKSYLFSIAGTVLVAVLQPLLQSWFAPADAAQGESRGGPHGARAPGPMDAVNRTNRREVPHE